MYFVGDKQESPAIADKPRATWKHAKIAQIRRAYNVVAYRSIFIRLAVLSLKSAKSREILWKFKLIEIKVIQGHRSWYQSKAHTFLLVTNSNLPFPSYWHI